MGKKKNLEIFDDKNIIEDTDKSFDNTITINDEPKSSDEIKTCKVIGLIPYGRAIIDFNGFGLIVNCASDKEFVDIKYSGKIGEADFKYEAI